MEDRQQPPLVLNDISSRQHGRSPHSVWMRACILLVGVLFFGSCGVYHYSLAVLLPKLRDFNTNVQKGYDVAFGFSSLLEDAQTMRANAATALRMCNRDVEACNNTDDATWAVVRNQLNIDYVGWCPEDITVYTTATATTAVSTIATGTAAPNVAVDKYPVNTLSTVLQGVRDWSTWRCRILRGDVEAIQAAIIEINVGNGLCNASADHFCTIHAHASKIAVDVLSGNVEHAKARSKSWFSERYSPVRDQLKDTYLDFAEVFHLVPYILLLAIVSFALFWKQDRGCCFSGGSWLSRSFCCSYLCTVSIFVFFICALFQSCAPAWGSYEPMNSQAEYNAKYDLDGGLYRELYLLLPAPKFSYEFERLKQLHPAFWDIVLEDLFNGAKLLLSAIVGFLFVLLFLVVFSSSVCARYSSSKLDWDSVDLENLSEVVAKPDSEMLRPLPKSSLRAAGDDLTAYSQFQAPEVSDATSQRVPLLPQATVADAVTVTCTRHLFCIGTYVRTSIQPSINNAGRVIFKGPGTKHLFYWAAIDKWVIGDDYNSCKGWLTSTRSESWCPSHATGWREWDPHTKEFLKVHSIGIEKVNVDCPFEFFEEEAQADSLPGLITAAEPIQGAILIVGVSLARDFEAEEQADLVDLVKEMWARWNGHSGVSFAVAEPSAGRSCIILRSSTPPSDSLIDRILDEMETISHFKRMNDPRWLSIDTCSWILPDDVMQLWIGAILERFGSTPTQQLDLVIEEELEEEDLDEAPALQEPFQILVLEEARSLDTAPAALLEPPLGKILEEEGDEVEVQRGKQAKCVAAILVTGSSYSLCNGTFVRCTTPSGANNGGRSIYKGPGKKYMFYWSEIEKWMVGDDYNAQKGWLCSARCESSCPTEASAWKEWNSTSREFLIAESLKVQEKAEREAQEEQDANMQAEIDRVNAEAAAEDAAKKKAEAERQAAEAAAEEAEKKNAESERRAQQEQEAKMQAEIDRMVAEAAAEEDAKRKAEEERQAAEQRKAQALEEQRRAEGERQAAEAAAEEEKRKAEEERHAAEQRKAQELEEQRRAEEERQAAEAAAEEERQKAEGKRKALEEREAQIKAEVDRALAEAAAEEEVKQKAEEERQAAEAKKEAERKAQEEQEANIQAEIDRMTAEAAAEEEAKKKAEAERQAHEERMAKEEHEAKKKADEERRAGELATEEAKKKIEAERARQEQEAKMQAALDRETAAEEEAKKKAEEARNAKEEQEAKQKAEEERQAADAAAKKKADAERKAQEEQEANMQAEIDRMVAEAAAEEAAKKKAVEQAAEQRKVQEELEAHSKAEEKVLEDTKEQAKAALEEDEQDAPTLKAVELIEETFEEQALREEEEERRRIEEDMNYETRKNEARQNLADAIQECRLDVLRTALATGEKFNVSASLLSQARMLIDRLVNTATKELKASINGFNVAALDDAIENARAAVVNADLIQEAVERREELVRVLAAQDKLLGCAEKAAIEDIELLQREIASAEASGVDYDSIFKARQALKRLNRAKRQRDAENEMLEAMHAEDLMRLDAAIEEAEQAKVENQSILSEAKELVELLRVIDGKERARATLLKATSDRNLRALEEAIARAEEVDIGEEYDEEIAEGRAIVMELEIYEALHLDGGYADGIEHALEKARNNGVEPKRIEEGLYKTVHLLEAEFLEYRCEHCKALLESSLLVGHAKLRRLEMIVAKELATTALIKVRAGDSIDAIREAIAHGEECEVDASEISASNARIEFLKERARASAELSVAVEREDLAFLQWSLSTAKTAKADPKLIQYALEKLEVLEEKARAAEMYRMKTREKVKVSMFRTGRYALDAVDIAVEEAYNDGLPIRIVQPTYEESDDNLDPEKNKARHELNTACADGTVPALRHALTTAQRASLQPSEMVHAKKQLRHAAMIDANNDRLANRGQRHWKYSESESSLEVTPEIVEVDKTMPAAVNRPRQTSNRRAPHHVNFQDPLTEHENAQSPPAEEQFVEERDVKKSRVCSVM